MIKVDLSNFVHPRLGIYLLGLIPGLFFESSIAIANAAFAGSVISRLHQIYPFGSYALLLSFLLSSWLIGSGFFFAAWVTERLIFYVLVLSGYVVRHTLGSQWLDRRFGRLQGFPPKQTFFIRSSWKLIMWARQRELPIEARPVLKCLHRATKQLLKERYGIDVSSDLLSDGVWYSVLGKPLKGIQEAIVATRTVLGCGLAGFTALYASPSLRERYFVSLCCMFAIPSLFYLSEVAFWNFDPTKRSLLRLKSILLELSDATTHTVDGEDRISAKTGVNQQTGALLEDD